MKSGLPIDLNYLINSMESCRVEFKAGWDQWIKAAVIRSICAFANDFLNINGGYIVLGIEEQEGKTVLPPRGLDNLNIDRIQNEIRGACKGLISPEYYPQIYVETVEDKSILVVWAPAGENRAYEAPRGNEEKGKTYWVRIGSSTVEAQGNLRRQLFEQASKIPFDDRRSLSGELGDISLVLLNRYLEDTQSDLASMRLNAESILNKYRLLARVNNHNVPKNAALLFFNEDPERFFPGSRIEVVQFLDEGGGNIFEEKIFQGPLPAQIHSCLNYLEGFGGAIIQKVSGRAEAIRTTPYPYLAYKEAIVNAVYHRSYEFPPEPVKIKIYPDQMRITSSPGPVRGIEREHFKNLDFPDTPKRNRRIGEFLKSLNLAQEYGSGILKIHKAMKENGSPEADFKFNPDRTYFTVILPVHPRYQEIHASGPPPALRIPDIYRRWVIDRCKYIDIKNLTAKEKVIHVRLPDEIFIPLYTDPINEDTGKVRADGKKLERKQKPVDIGDLAADQDYLILEGPAGFGKTTLKERADRKKLEEKQEPVDIEDLAADMDYLIVEGPAGSGKTTLLKHLAFSIMQKASRKGLDNYIPVLISLKDLQGVDLNGKKLQPSASVAESLLSSWLKKADNGLDIDTVKRYCREGKAIFLMDGLDEMDPGMREVVVDSFADLRIKYNQSKMVWAGRSHGIDHAVVNRFGDKHIKIHPLNREQVESFINNRFEFIHDKESVTEKRTAGEMIGEIRAHSNVEQLTDTPLMLTAVCILYHDCVRLPEQRAELYDKFINSIVHDELEKEDKSPFKRWRLASLSFLDIHQANRKPAVVKGAKERLISIFDKEGDPKIKADAGEILGRLGDPRDLEEFVKIEGGNYELEGMKNKNIAPFEMGQYPVTNRWFEKFIRAEGYKKEEYWSPEGWKWRNRNNFEHPEYWNDRKWRCPNSPVVGVSWYEGDAFCRWLTSMRQDDCHYRLPAEEEWLAAAAGKEKREYPWGERWKKNLCNIKEVGIARNSPVGIFPNGNTPDNGIADMVGNVWEWTCTDFDSQEKKDDFIHSVLGPVVHGGAWSWSDKSAFCKARRDNFPSARNDNTGFRCSRTYRKLKQEM